MPKTIYEEDEVILSKDFFSDYNLWEIGQALRKVIIHIERELITQSEKAKNDEIKKTIEGRLKMLMHIRNAIAKYTG